MKNKVVISVLKWVGLIVLLLSFISWWGHTRNSDSGSVLIYNETDIAGNLISSDSLKGKWVIINIWATWCPPCRLEIPGLERVHDPSDVVVLGVTTDEVNDLTEFMKTHTIDYPVILPSAGLMARLNQFHQIEKLPTTFIFDRNGRLVKIQEGFYGEWQIRWDKFWYDN
ncbi:MAG: TlpA family protein disulfide reductase [Bacteroidetes bacterium]|nr:TlpA family protein disulfide reductase [Bacteroidota bacterium]